MSLLNDPRGGAVVPEKKPEVGVGRPSGGAASVAGRPTKEEQPIVMQMQQLLGHLSTGLEKDPKLDEKLPRRQVQATEFKTREALIGALITTGTGQGTPDDGKWGTNTSKALRAAQAIAKIVEETLKKNISEIDPATTTYTQRKPEEVISAANKNIKALSELTVAVGMPVPGKVDTYTFDFIPYGDQLGADSVDPRTDTTARNMNTLYGKSLKSLFSFYTFLQTVYGGHPGLKPTGSIHSKDYIEKIAQKIKNSLIIRAQQGAALPGGFPTPVDPSPKPSNIDFRPMQIAEQHAGPWGSKTKPTQTQQPEAQQAKQQISTGNMLTVGQIDTALEWFAKRSNMLYRVIQMGMEEGGSNPITKKEYTQEDLTSARSYFDAIQQLAALWTKTRREIWEKASKSGRVSNAADLSNLSVDPIDLESGQTSIGETGAARKSRVGGGFSVDIGGDEEMNEKTKLQYAIKDPPIKDSMDILEVADMYEVPIEDSNMKDNLIQGRIVRGQWTNPTEFLNMYIKGFSLPPPNGLATPQQQVLWGRWFFTNVRYILVNVYGNWQKLVQPYSREPSLGIEQKVTSQNRNLTAWLNTITAAEHRLNNILLNQPPR